MDKELFYNVLRKDRSIFGSRLSASRVKGMEGILDAFNANGDGSVKTLAYALATAYHETGGRMVPVREGFARTDASARRAVNNLAKRRGSKSAVARYAKEDPETGEVYYGRGHVQLTWKDNYRKSSKDAGVNLVLFPDSMLDPETSAKVLISGLIDGRWNGKGKGIGYYLKNDDLKNARRTVNITDKWKLIAGYYKSFLNALVRAGGVDKVETNNVPQGFVDLGSDVAAEGRFSTEKIVSGLGGASMTMAAVNEAVDEFGYSVSSISELIPSWLIPVLLIGGALAFAYTWYRRNEKQKIAKALL